MLKQALAQPPRGALIVVAVGLLATVAAALLSNPNASAGAVEIEWEQHAPLADSKVVAVPGGRGRAQLVEGEMRATGRNVSGYQLFRATDVLSISKGAAVGGGRVKCSIRVPSRHTLVTHTPGNRAAYPRPSEEDELIKQEVPENVVVEFNAKGTDVALVELGDAFEKFSNERGITVSWSSFRIGQQGWQWGLPQGRTIRPLRLAFGSIWRTTVPPSARVSCLLTTSAGSVSVGTAGTLPGAPQPIAE
jgi:hypothetical protein